MGPFPGKTYSLYSDSHANTSDDYYRTIKKIADSFLQDFAGDEKKLLSHLRKARKKRSLIKKLLGKENSETLADTVKNKLHTSLAIYTKNVKDHLRTLSLFDRFDSVLRTTAEQYHLYMLEIELVNRIYRDIFKKCTYKFALLPHCLRDFNSRCVSTPGDIEHICKGCTRECYIHRGSKLLKAYGIEPYISVTIDQDKLLKEVKAKHPSVGVLGIACIPELARGMRLAIHLGIPPLGVPLDANRCARWLGKAYENSFDLNELEELVK